MYADTRYYPDPLAWRLEAELWHDGEDIDPEEQEFMDAFDALCTMQAHELEAYTGVALEADVDTMEV